MEKIAANDILRTAAATKRCYSDAIPHVVWARN